MQRIQKGGRQGTRTPDLLRVKKRLDVQKPLLEVFAFKALLLYTLNQFMLAVFLPTAQGGKNMHSTHGAIRDFTLFCVMTKNAKELNPVHTWLLGFSAI